MIFFDRDNHEKTIKLLKDSRQDFQFDQQSSKARLMMKLNRPGHEQALPRMHHWHILRYGAMVACVVILVSGTFAFAANSQPGDTLFPLNKFGENVILSLPLSAQTKAAIHTKIVSNRLQALDQIQQQAQGTQVQVDTRSLETVQESDDTINAAIETISANRDSFQAAGRMQAAQQLSDTLNKLEQLAAEHEQKIETLEAETADNQIKQQMQTHLKHIRQERDKAILEIQQNNTYEQSEQPNK